MDKSKSRGGSRERSKSRGGRKGKKKDPLTDEEKAAKVLKKAWDEQEKRAKRELLTQAFLEIKRKKEYELVKVSHAKLIEQWRPLLRNIKIKELLEDYKKIQRAFEKAYDKKAFLINVLANTMTKNEEEYDAAVDMHMYNIDRIMEFLRARMKDVMQSYVTEKTKLEDNLSEEQNYINYSHGKGMQSIRGVIAQSELQKLQANQDAEAEIRTKEEIFRAKATEEFSSLQYKMELKIHRLWTETHDSILEFTLLNERKLKEYVPFLEQDQKMSKILDSHYNQMCVLQTGMKALNEKSETFTRAFDKHMVDLKAKKAECLEKYNFHISFHNEESKRSNTAFRNLALTSQSTVTKLEEFLKIRERVLRSIERCRKQERQEEKEQPFKSYFNVKRLSGAEDLELKRLIPPAETKISNTEDCKEKGWVEVSPTISRIPIPPPVKCAMLDGGCNSAICKCCVGEAEDWKKRAENLEDSNGETEQLGPQEGGLNPTIKAVVMTFAPLENFWRRYNRVELERNSLRTARAGLMKENEKLRLALRNYIGGMDECSIDTKKFTQDQME